MRPEQAEEIARDAYEDRRDKMGYDEIRHIEAVADEAFRLYDDLDEKSGDVNSALDDVLVVGWLREQIQAVQAYAFEVLDDLGIEPDPDEIEVWIDV